MNNESSVGAPGAIADVSALPMTTDVASLPTRETDVLVIGGGPAGAAMGYWMAEHGHDVVVVERK
ncbi:MAG: FAD-dependent oxidoreductase, partial [Actinomycetota bacterium]